MNHKGHKGPWILCVRCVLCVLCGSFIALLASGALVLAQIDTTFFDAIDHAAIQYATRPVSDAVNELNGRLASGAATLRFEETGGYLRSTLEALQVPIDSQIAVFSKTSLQAQLIGPANPRTILFNDSVVVAWMRGGVIEIAAHDPQQGTVFYVLPQQPLPSPRFIRSNGCLQCHYSYATLGVPGMLTRSVITDPRGGTMPYLGNYTTDHRSPFAERWAGWYVTGSVGPMRHLGNAMVADRDKVDEAVTKETLNARSLEGRFDTSAYLSSHSDVAALMVFNHQMTMINLITRLGWEARVGSTTLRSHVREFVDYLLFVGEAPLSGAVRGSTSFARTFPARGPRDTKGRSLRELDLERRLLRYPCSYMIYSAAFDALLADTRREIYQRLWEVLSGADKDPRYARLSATDRQAVIEIVRETKTNLPEYWRE